MLEPDDFQYGRLAKQIVFLLGACVPWPRVKRRALHQFWCMGFGTGSEMFAISVPIRSKFGSAKNESPRSSWWCGAKTIQGGSDTTPTQGPHRGPCWSYSFASGKPFNMYDILVPLVFLDYVWGGAVAPAT